MAELTWVDEQRCFAGDHRFLVMPMPMGGGPDELVVAKSQASIRRYVGLLREEQPRRIIELGIKDGGSTALVWAVAEPEAMLAIDLAPTSDRLLLDLAASTGGALQLSFSTDQSDQSAVETAYWSAFGAGSVDLVIDDASHDLDLTRASFEILFPRLAPGGVFVVEDWVAGVIIRHILTLVFGDEVTDGHVGAVAAILDQLNSPELEVDPVVWEAMGRPSPEIPAAAMVASEFFVRLIVAAGRAAMEGIIDPVVTYRPLTDLIVELSMIAAVRPDVVAEVSANSDWVAIRRGPADLEAEPLDTVELSRSAVRYVGR